MLRAGWRAVLQGLCIAALGMLAAASGPSQSDAQSKLSGTIRHSATSTSASGPARLVVATYNINCGIRDAKSFAAFTKIIQQSGADILAVQEGNDALWGYLRNHLKGYPYIYPQKDNGAAGLAWVSKVPLTGRAVLPPTGGGWSSTLICRTKIGDREIQIVNAHLFATIPPENAEYKEVMTVFVAAERVRKSEIAFICSKLAPKVPVVMLGDFNSPPGSYAPAYLKDRDMVDSYASANRDDPDATTWQWALKKSTLKLKLDYIFHGPQFRTRTSRIVREGNSDHFMVVSEIELRPPTTSEAAQSRATLATKA